MAERRMFSKTIVDSDAFLDMPLSTQALYFHLNMRADDDGFLNNVKRIQKATGASDDDLRLLFAKKFIIPFESGIVVIKHWRINNYIRKDLYKETNYKEEKKLLKLDENNAYTMGFQRDCNVTVTEPLRNRNEYVTKPSTQYSIGKDSIGKDSIDIHSVNDTTYVSKPVKHKHGEYNNVLLTDKDLSDLKRDYPNYQELITYLDEYIEMKGYKAKSHYLAIKKWVVRVVEEDNRKNKHNISVDYSTNKDDDLSGILS